jgi:hypothetical protein
MVSASSTKRFLDLVLPGATFEVPRQFMEPLGTSAGAEGLTDHSSRDLYGRAAPPSYRRSHLPNAGKGSKGLFERTTASVFCWPEVSEQAAWRSARLLLVNKRVTGHE